MAKKVLSGKDNTNGFQKNPQNINRSGANGSSVTKFLKQIGEGNIIEIEITTTNSNGERRKQKTKLRSKKNLNQALAMLLFQKAMSGDLQAIKEVLDRTEGKPLQKQEIKAASEASLNIIVDNEGQKDKIDEMLSGLK